MTQRGYTFPLLGCFGDLEICIYGTFCSYFLNASNIAYLRGENCGPYHLLFPFNPFWVRQMVRENNQIPVDRIDDLLVTCFCHPCMICQDSREIRQNL